MNNDEITKEYKSISGSVDVSYNLVDLEEQLNIQSYLLQDTLSKKIKLSNKCLIQDNTGVMYIAIIYSDIRSTQSEIKGEKFNEKT